MSKSGFTPDGPSSKLMAPMAAMATAFGAPERLQPQAFANLVRLLHRQTILRTCC